jgi:hypothetical protein
MDSSESMLLGSGLGYVLVFGLSSLTFDYALKKETNIVACYFHF